MISIKSLIFLNTTSSTLTQMLFYFVIRRVTFKQLISDWNLIIVMEVVSRLK